MLIYLKVEVVFMENFLLFAYVFVCLKSELLQPEIKSKYYAYVQTVLSSSEFHGDKIVLKAPAIRNLLYMLSSQVLTKKKK